MRRNGVFGGLVGVAALSALALSGCDEANALCDLGCDADGLINGNAAVSGDAKIDAFFKAVLRFEGAATSLSSDIQTDIEAIYGDFGFDTNASFQSQFDAQVMAYIQGGVQVDIQEPVCKVDAQVAIDAAAECDAEVDPGMVEVECKGSCEAEASAMVECSGEVKCVVEGPRVECSGSCEGTCAVQLDAAARCEGTCRGECSGDCDALVKNSMGQLECAGNCDGQCMGECQAQLEANATCEGKCTGTCVSEPPMAGCEGNVRCEAMADASVMCSGECDGEVTPPMVSAECQASVEAEASLDVSCEPPSIAINYELRTGGGVDAEGQAAFVAALENLKTRLPALKASLAKSDRVLSAAANLGSAAEGAVRGSIQAVADGGVEGAAGATCAIANLKHVPTILGEARSELEASAQASADVAGTFGI